MKESKNTSRKVLFSNGDRNLIKWVRIQAAEDDLKNSQVISRDFISNLGWSCNLLF